MSLLKYGENIILQIPKTGSTSLELCRNWNKVAFKHASMWNAPVRFRQIHSFIREPKDWLFSQFCYMRNIPTHYGNWIANQGFDTWLIWYISNMGVTSNPGCMDYFCQQSDYWKPGQHVFLYDFAKYKIEVSRLMDNLGIKHYELPHVNMQSKTDYNISVQSEKLINQYFKTDTELYDTFRR